MPTYEVEIDGQTFEIEAPDDQSVQLAVRQLQGQQPQSVAPSQASGALDDYYSSGIYAGEYNPLGAVARSVDAATTGLQDMLTFGFSDEMKGALPGGNIENERARQAALRESNPIASTVGQIAGGVAGAGGLGRMGLSLTGRLAPNASMLSRVGAGAAEGAAYGGAYGFGSGEGTSDRLGQAATDATLGALLGGAIPMVAQGASSAYRSVADRMAGNQAARQAGVSPEVARMLSETLEADGSLGPQGLANMQRAGQEAMLADAGPNARAVLDTAIQRGGPGAVLARGRIDERVGRGAADLTAALDNSLGQPQGVTAARSAIRQGSAGARGNAYDTAYAQPIDYASPVGQDIENLVRTRVPGNVIAQANRLMQLEGNQSQQILARVGDDGSVVFEQLPDVRQLDYITRALNQAAESGEGAGALGGQTTLGRAYQGLSREIRSRLRDAVPEYAMALDTAADPIRRSQAVELGARILSPGMRRDQVAEAVQGMSAAERDALAQGVRSQIDDAVANVTRTVQDGNVDAREAVKAIKDLSSRANREKLRTAIGDQRADALFDELDRIATSFNLRASVAENSKTFARQAVAGRIGEMTAPGPVGTLAQGEPINAGKRIVQALTGQTPERMTARENEIFSQIADYLTRPSSQAIPAFQAMQNFGTQTAANQARAAQIARLLSQGRLGVYPTSALLGEELR